MASGRGVNVGVGNISISPVLVPGFGALLQAQLSRINPTIQINPQINQQGLRNLNGQLNSTTGAATRLRTVFTGAFAALQARAIQQRVSALSGLSNKLTEVAGAATSVGSALGPLLGLVGGLGAGLAIAGAGVGAFAALAAPQIKAVTTASQAATKAQDAYNTAIATGDTAGAQKALQDRAAALATLTPAQRVATTATLQLKDAFKAQSDALAPVTLGLYTNGVRTLTGLLPALAPVAKAAGTALQGIFGQAQAGLKGALSDDGGIGAFLNVVKTQIGPVLSSLSTIVVNLGRTLSNVFQAAVPAIQPALTVLKQLTGELSNASGGEGLLNFFKQVAPLLQPLRAALTSIGAALGSFIQAALPLAGPVLNAVNVLASALFNLFNGDFFHQFVANIASIVSQIAPLFQQLVGPLGRVIDVISGQFAALLPTLIPVIVQFANVFSNVLVGLSPLLPLFAQLIGILVQFLPIVYPIIQALRAALAPILKAVGQALIAIMPAINAVIQAFVPLLPLIGKLLAAFVPLIAQLINGFAPVVVAILDALKPLIPIITQIAKLIAGYFVQAITIIFKAITPLLPVLSQLASQILTALLQVFKAIEPILLGVIKQFVQLLPALLPIVQVAARLLIALLPLIPPLVRLSSLVIPALVAIIKILAPIVVALGNVFTWLVKVVVAALTWILNTANSFVTGFTGFFRRLGHDVSAIWNGMWDGIKLVVLTSWNAIYNFFTKTIGPAFKKIWQDLVAAAKTVWNGLKAVFADPVIAVFKVIGQLAHIVDDVTSAVALGKPLASIEKAAANTSFLKFSSGGIVPGYGGGDRHPALLEGGEVTVRKESVRAMGGPKAVHQAFNRNAIGGPPIPGAGRDTGTIGSGVGVTAEGTLSKNSFGGLAGVAGGVGSVVSAPFDAAKWVLNEAQHLLRVGAANAINSAYQGLIKPVLSAFGNVLPGKIAIGSVNTGEKKLIDWIRGKESADISGTFVGGQLVWPLPGFTNISQLFHDPKTGGTHPGIDIPAPLGTSIVAANSGTVTDAGPATGFGNWIRILGQGLGTVYGHMYDNGLLAKVGQVVKAGQRIALVGSNGESTGPHLHFEVHPGSFASGPVDPLAYLRGPGGNAAPGTPQALAQGLLPQFGWGPDQFAPLNTLWTGESGWDVHATNPYSGAYGIPQSLPASKMASAGADWHDSALTQERWGLGYIRDVYGSPAGALSAWLSRSPHWYGAGGVAPKGWAGVGDRGAELVNFGSSSRILSNTDSIQALVRPAAALAIQALVSGTSGGGSRPPLIGDGAIVNIGDNVDMDLALSKHDFAQRQGDL